MTHQRVTFSPALMRLVSASVVLVLAGIFPGTKFVQSAAASVPLHTALVAEGVETQGNWDFLTGLGCDEGQEVI